MTMTERKIIKAKVGLLELVKQLGSVTQACRVMVPAHPRYRSGRWEGIGKALDATMGLLIQALDGPAPRPVVALA